MLTKKIKLLSSFAIVFALLLCSLAPFCPKARAEGNSQDAERFITLVNSFTEVSDLDERLELIEYVKSEGVYFDDESYPGITEALDALASISSAAASAKEACDLFIAAVDNAQLTDIEDYLTHKAALSAASQYSEAIDLSYDGVTEARSIYMTLLSELQVLERYNEEFLAAVEKIAEEETYSDRRVAYKYAIEYMYSDSFIPEYEGVDDAILTLKAIEDGLKADISLANIFISAVSRLGTGESLALDIIAAYQALVGVDRTTDGTEGSLAILNSAVEDYNREAEKINTDFGNL